MVQRYLCNYKGIDNVVWRKRNVFPNRVRDARPLVEDDSCDKFLVDVQSYPFADRVLHDD